MKCQRSAQQMHSAPKPWVPWSYHEGKSVGLGSDPSPSADLADGCGAHPRHGEKCRREPSTQVLAKLPVVTALERALPGRVNP